MEVDDSSLASLLPLQPNGSAMLPVRLLVGRAPRNTSLEDFTLEVSEGHQDWQAMTIGHSGKMVGPRKFVLKGSLQVMTWTCHDEKKEKVIFLCSRSCWKSLCVGTT